ncbi:helix-turn-helix domain-containing protein [Streptomyces marianii]|uniref:Helix-turn-helix domain-containing protein n=1 Tax=Streptomyces marianii TaxID=1817406 RepID=A0A5R9E547_9ACTN|nr:helix-turn-helix domain-containing protein [Streptomyces marianii]TLQ44185.1 helix-turn-helix domain-containing protein [Streptomyces marianii]
MTKSTSDSTEAAAPPLPPPKERRRLREGKALSEEQLAEALGVTGATIRSWETGRSDPRGRKREAYARLLAAYEAELSALGSAPGDEGGARPADGADRRDEANRRDEADRRDGQRSGSPSSAPNHRPGEGPPTGRTEPSGNAPAGPDARGTTSGDATAASPATRTSGDPAAEHLAGVPATGPRKAPAVRPGDTPPPLEPPRPYPATTPPRAPVERTEAPAAARHATAAGPAGATEAAAGGHPAEPCERPPARDGAAPLTAEQAFDELYARAAPGLVRQTLLLTGRQSLSREAVERAFHLAWQRWPEVAVDRDPAGWVRAAAYEYAMSPWHRLRRAHRRHDPVSSARPASVAYPGGRTLREAVLGLPPSYRRALLLYDGLGLDLPETAAETEASTPAAANRLLHARAAVAEQIPELAEPEALQHELGDLVANLSTPRIASARDVRGGSERRAELWTRAAIGLTVLILGAAAVTTAVTEDHYEPPQAPGERVGGVPPRSGPEPWSKEDYRLRVQLHSHPGAGPARLVPLAR